jgi:hypothetical protein
MRVPTPDTGENNAAYWRKRAEEAEAKIRRVEAFAEEVERMTGGPALRIRAALDDQEGTL